MKPRKQFEGHLKITKIYKDDRADEVVVDEPNVITIGLASFLADIMMGEYGEDTPLQDIGMQWLQLGASSQSDYATNYFYELSSAFTIPDYGTHTSLNFQTEYQVSAVNPFYDPPTLTETQSSFLKFDEDHMDRIGDDKVIFTVLIDENTLNDKAITEAGLFYNKSHDNDNLLLELAAYKAFGVTDASGVVSPIHKTKDFVVQIEWVMTTNTGKVIAVHPTESGDTYNFYQAATKNPNGNALVCYFPDVTVGNEPYTKYSTTLSQQKGNVETRLFQRLLSNGFSVVSFDYTFVDSNDISGCRVFTSAVDSNAALLPSSTSPFRMPSGIQNCYTDAVSAVQWAKYYGETNWEINPSNVFTAGAGFGGTLAAFMAYGPECSSTLGNDTYEVCSSRVLGTSVKSAVMDWDRWYPYTLSTFDFKLATLPKALDMYGPKYQTASGVLTSSATLDYETGDWTTTSLSGMSGTVSSYVFDRADFTAASGFYWSAIPDLKALYQWRNVPHTAKRFWSPVHQCSSASAAVDSDFPGAFWGHLNNNNVYAHFSYAGSSVSAGNWSEYPHNPNRNFKLLDYSSNSYIDMGPVREPAVNMDVFSLDIAAVSDTSALVETAYNNEVWLHTSALSNDMRDEMQGKQLWELLQASGQDTSSLFVNYAPYTFTTPGSNYQAGSINTFTTWNYNMEELCARDRVNWFTQLIKEYDSWYDQFG